MSDDIELHIAKVENLIKQYRPCAKYIAFARFFMEHALEQGLSFAEYKHAFQVTRDNIIMGSDDDPFGFDELVEEWESCLEIKYDVDYKCIVPHSASDDEVVEEDDNVDGYKIVMLR